MNTNDYLELSMRTCKDDYTDSREALEGDVAMDLLHATLGISGEAGEIVDTVKKSIIYGKVLDSDNLKEELGDLMWYVSLLVHALADVTGDTPARCMSSILEENVAKLAKRYPNLYNNGDAINRADKS